MLAIFVSVGAATFAVVTAVAYLRKYLPIGEGRSALVGCFKAAALGCVIGYVAHSVWAWITYEPMQCYWKDDQMVGCLIGRQKIHAYECATYVIEETKYGKCNP